MGRDTPLQAWLLDMLHHGRVKGNRKPYCLGKAGHGWGRGQLLLAAQLQWLDTLPTALQEAHHT